ncbi:hypothetical protein DAEQUDRAFT_763305 [Daedalea quercina L-15889]|uniref:Inhibitor I9 domain-containing protein n=1 Tax=Daedalea quercina L-15889 TaxID=1314783 RepID=A0A165SLY0_9APHY|nr:hypothetical protein DAEQUDRAFT_763305 [Daedalea quercina L-15889]
MSDGAGSGTVAVAEYIVVFKEHATQEQVDRYAQDVSANGGHIEQRFGSLLNGFSATIPESYLTQLQGENLIDYIEPDQIVTTQ